MFLLHPPLPAEHPLLPLLSRVVMTSLSVLETLFQDLGGGTYVTESHIKLDRDSNELVVPLQRSGQRWAPALFSRFCAREREAKKERDSAKKKEREKSKSAERERKKREFALFPPPTVEIRFQIKRPLGRGQARVSKMYSSVGMPVLLLQSCSVCSVLPIPLCLSYSACPVQPVLFCLSYSVCLSCSAFPVLPVLFCLSCLACPALPIPFCLSVLFCLSCSVCPVLPVLFCLSCFCLPCPIVLSWLSCHDSLVLPVPF
jgi:hypothetical protein